MLKLDEKVEELKVIIETEPGDGDVSGLERLNYRLSDAIREGSRVSRQEYGWGNGDTACALHAAVVAAKARGYMP